MGKKQWMVIHKKGNRCLHDHKYKESFYLEKVEKAKAKKAEGMSGEIVRAGKKRRQRRQWGSIQTIWIARWGSTKGTLMDEQILGPF